MNTIATTKQAYYCAGISSYTYWQLYSTIGMTMNIDTTNRSFNSTPYYFTSLAGSGYHWVLDGYTAIYFPTNISFTIYARPWYTWNNVVLLNYSQVYKWDINWFGFSY